MVNLQTYIGIIHPSRFRETIEREVKKQDSRAAFTNIFLISLLIVFFSIVAYSLFPRIAPPGVDGGSFLYKMTAFNPVASPLGILISLVWGIVFYYLIIVTLHTIAKALGGKGKLGNLLYCSSIVALSFTIVSLPFTLGLLIPAVSCIAAIPYLVLSIYSMYIQYKILRAVHTSLTRGRAIATYLLHLIVMFLSSFIYLFLRIALGI